MFLSSSCARITSQYSSISGNGEVWGSAGWLALSMLSFHCKIMMLKRFHMLQIEAFMVIYDSFRLIKIAGRVHSVYCS